MPRSNFDFATAGNCTYIAGTNSPVNSLVEDARFYEHSNGVSRRKPTGFIQPTNYVYTHRVISNAHGSHRMNWKFNGSNFQSFEGVIGFANGVNGRFHSSEHFDSCLSEEDNSTFERVSSAALIKARSALKTSGVNLGVAFAERNKTAKLVGDTATSLFKSLRALKRGQVRHAMDLLGITSSRREPRGSNVPKKWLELQYGWKPLLSDVYNACDALSKRDGRDWRVTVKGRASEVESRGYTRLSFDAFDMTASRRTSSFVRIDAFPSNEVLISLQSLGITNPLIIGWELVPFSFVVDWFLPIGSWLESLDATLGFKDFSCSVSTLTKGVWIGRGRFHEDTNFVYLNDFVEVKHYTNLVRTATQHVPFPKFPRFKDPRSLGHMANALSLLAGVVGSIRR